MNNWEVEFIVYLFLKMVTFLLSGIGSIRILLKTNANINLEFKARGRGCQLYDIRETLILSI